MKPELPPADTNPADPGPDPANPAPKAKARTGEKRARLNQALTLELRALRASITQCLDAYDLRVGGRIAEMLQVIEGDEALAVGPRPFAVKTAQTLLDQLARLEIDPRKGRPRDLRRIQRLVKRLGHQMPG
jgi:hypothetical protein